MGRLGRPEQIRVLGQQPNYYIPKSITNQTQNPVKGRPNRGNQVVLSEVNLHKESGLITTHSETTKTQTTKGSQSNLSVINLKKEENPQHIEEQQAVLKYWFLLEKELVEAFAKGNLSLLDIARGKINFLLKILEPSLLEEGLKGEEEALCEIHRFLMNNGWWVKANNLSLRKMGKKWNPEQQKKLRSEEEDTVKFIFSKEKWVHPNVIKMVLSRDTEGIRMALNQIPYGSLMERRNVMETKELKERCEKMVASGQRKRDVSNGRKEMEQEDYRFEIDKGRNSKRTEVGKEEIMLNFIKEHRTLIEEDVFSEALKGDDKAISFALGQIHHRYLEGWQQKSGGTVKRTYKEILLKVGEKENEDNLLKDRHDRSQNREIKKKEYSKSRQSKTVFFTGFPENVLAKNLWILFKNVVRIKDIILPKKKDKRNKRYGFIKVKNYEMAERLIKTFKGYKMRGYTLQMCYARDEKRKESSLQGDKKISPLQGDKKFSTIHSHISKRRVK